VEFTQNFLALQTHPSKVTIFEAAATVDVQGIGPEQQAKGGEDIPA
jgi:hypothetical protein